MYFSTRNENLVYKKTVGLEPVLPSGCVERVYIMKAMDAARAALLASQPGPNTENAITPMAAQPI